MKIIIIETIIMILNIFLVRDYNIDNDSLFNFFLTWSVNINK